MYYYNEKKSKDNGFLYLIAGSIAAVCVIITIIAAMFCITGKKAAHEPNEKANHIGYIDEQTEEEIDQQDDSEDSQQDVKKKPQQTVNSADQFSRYYEKLSKREKEIYDRFEEKIYDMPKSIVLPSNSTMNELQKASDAFENDHVSSPLALTGRVQFSNSGIEQRAYFNYSLSKKEYEEKLAKLNAKVDEIAALVPKNASEFEKELFIHDYIVKHTTYKFSREPLSNGAYGALVDNVTACQGYSQAMKLILNKVGIDCILVKGLGHGSGHMWNQVKIEGEWYNLDVTWDDPQGSGDVLRHDYFNMTDEDMSVSHKPDGETNTCVATANNYFVAEGLFFDTYNEKAKRTIKAKIKNMRIGDAVEFRFSSKKEYEKAKKKIQNEEYSEFSKKFYDKSRKNETDNGIFGTTENEEILLFGLCVFDNRIV